MPHQRSTSGEVNVLEMSSEYVEEIVSESEANSPKKELRKELQSEEKKRQVC